eukprot:scaffold3330_cov398-Pinguiococcus_pyrenoidosus.AAC.6
MQVVAHAAEEELPQRRWCLVHAGLLRVLPHGVVDTRLLDLLVVEQKRGGPGVAAGLEQQTLEVVAELDAAVLLADLDAEGVVLRNKGRQPRERLAPAAAHANEHEVGTG